MRAIFLSDRICVGVRVYIVVLKQFCTNEIIVKISTTHTDSEVYQVCVSVCLTAKKKSYQQFNRHSKN